MAKTILDDAKALNEENLREWKVKRIAEILEKIEELKEYIAEKEANIESIKNIKRIPKRGECTLTSSDGISGGCSTVISNY